MKARDPRLIDLTGQRFGMLIPRRYVPDVPGKRYGCWLCRCDCGGETLVTSWALREGRTRSCGVKHARLGSDNPRWKGCGDITGDRWGNIQRSAVARRHTTFTLRIEQAWRLFLGQERRCALSGLPLWFKGAQHDDTTASLDRIDSAGHYEVGNVQWVHKRVNLMKNILTQDEFIAFCRAVAETHPRRRFRVA